MDNNGTTSNSSEYFAIDTTDGASEPVLISNLTAESGYTTDSFYIYGTQITWLTSTTQMESQFYARETDTDGVFELYWETDTSATTEGTSVVLKTVPPPQVGRPSAS